MTKCDICDMALEFADGFVLTTREVTTSEWYWRRQLPRFESELAAFDARPIRERYLEDLAPPISLDSRLATTKGSSERGVCDVFQAEGVESDRRS